MNERSTFYWSHIKKFETCPQSFLWGYGWEGIDLGKGEGQPKEKPPQASRHHAVMGIVIQGVLEKMYNDELWKEPKILSKKLLDLVELEWVHQERKKKNKIDYDDAGMSRAEMIDICREGVAGYVKTMKAHKLLGSYAKAEVDLIGWINRWTCVGGVADFIIRRDDTGITILDGKNTKNKNSVDPDQLRWYALVFQRAYKVLPDRLGLIWYRFPHGVTTDNPATGTETVETGVEWIPFTIDDLRGLAVRAIEARNSMRREKFEATPSPSVCKYCDFVTVCPDRQEQRRENGEKRNANAKIEEISPGGFADFSTD